MLRENEWLMAIKQRAGIPGGTSEFDLPSYHHWLHHPAERRRADLEAWLKPLLPIHAALSIVLRVLRESGRTVSLIAFQGVYQQTPAEKPAQMLRLTLADELRLRARDQRQQVRAERALPPARGRAEEPRCTSTTCPSSSPSATCEPIRP